VFQDAARARGRRVAGWRSITEVGRRPRKSSKPILADTTYGRKRTPSKGGRRGCRAIPNNLLERANARPYFSRYQKKRGSTQGPARSFLGLRDLLGARGINWPQAIHTVRTASPAARSGRQGAPAFKRPVPARGPVGRAAFLLPHLTAVRRGAGRALHLAGQDFNASATPMRCRSRAGGRCSNASRRQNRTRICRGLSCSSEGARLRSKRKLAPAGLAGRVIHAGLFNDKRALHARQAVGVIASTRLQRRPLPPIVGDLLPSLVLEATGSF